MSKYLKLKDYEGMPYEDDTIVRMACCDCGVVHDTILVEEEGEPPVLVFKRNRRATAQLRRHKYGNLQWGRADLRYKMVKNG